MAISGAASKVAKKFQNSKINKKLTKKLDDVTSSLKSKTKNITANIAKKTKEVTQKTVNTVSYKVKTIANKTLNPIGANGVPIKNPRKGAFTVQQGLKKIQKEFKNGNCVIIDTRKLVPEHIEQLKKAIEEAGIADRIIWYP